jgi:uncharacterized membrane protein YqaE (UPF0057 family)
MNFLRSILDIILSPLALLWLGSGLFKEDCDE